MSIHKNEYTNDSQKPRLKAWMRPTTESGECRSDVWTTAWEAGSHNLRWQQLQRPVIPARTATTAQRDGTEQERIWLKRRRRGEVGGSKMDASHNGSILAVIRQQPPRECLSLPVKDKNWE